MRMTKPSQCLAAIALALFLPASLLADAHDDVLAVIMKYADLEGDLGRQAELIRPDRVMITGLRQTDQARNLELQMAARAANEAADGGPAKWITEIEDPEVRIYGNVAVASMLRRFHIYPTGAAPINAPPHWLTLVLVREGGSWGIAHAHLSPLWEPPD